MPKLPDLETAGKWTALIVALLTILGTIAGWWKAIAKWLAIKITRFFVTLAFPDELSRGQRSAERLDEMEGKVTAIEVALAPLAQLSERVAVVEQRTESIDENVKLLLAHAMGRPVKAPEGAYRAPGSTEPAR